MHNLSLELNLERLNVCVDLLHYSKLKSMIIMIMVLRDMLN